MTGQEGRSRLIARCIVCRTDIYEADSHEKWEGGFYCERHSLPHLRERARRYAELLRSGASIEPEERSLS